MYTDITLMQTMKLNETNTSNQEFIQRKSSNPSFATAKIQNLDNYD